MTETQQDKQSDREKNTMTKAKPVGVRDNNETITETKPVGVRQSDRDKFAFTQRHNRINKKAVTMTRWDK